MYDTSPAVLFDTRGDDRPRPRTQPEITAFRRLALMEGCIRSVARLGVAGTTVKTISAEAGVSRGLIDHYFGSKEALMAAALRHLYTTVARQIWATVEAAGPSALGRLRAWPAALFSPPVLTEVTCNAFIGFWHEVRFNPAVQQANRELYDGYVDRLEALFAAAAAEAGVTVDAHRAALDFIVLTDGLWLGLSIHDRIASLGQAVATCRRAIDQELAGQPRSALEDG